MQWMSTVDKCSGQVGFQKEEPRALACALYLVENPCHRPRCVLPRCRATATSFVQGLVDSRNFAFQRAPMGPWGCLMATPMLLSRLMGHRRVHLFISEVFLLQIGVVLRVLAGQGAPPSSGVRACLEHMKVTVMDTQRMVLKSKDMSAMKSWGIVEAALHKEAAQLGVTVEVQIIVPSPDDVGCLDALQPVEGEVVAVCCLYVWLRLTEDTQAGVGARTHVMQVRPNHPLACASLRTH